MKSPAEWKQYYDSESMESERLYDFSNPYSYYYDQSRSDTVTYLLTNAVELIGRNIQLLEVGCGSGYYLTFLNKIGVKRIIGADISLSKLTHLKGLLPESELIVCDAQHLPFRNNIFDLVLCSEVIEHLPDPGIILKEISYSSRRLAVVSTPTKTTFYRILLKFLGKDLKYGGTHLKELSQDELKKELKANGLSIRELKATPIIEFMGLWTLLTKFSRRKNVAKMLYSFNKMISKSKYLMRFGVFTCVLCEKV
ncbi:class I SAM-dependent methyltransferase [Candidatus Nitrososphaera sp. FF02]|uniref:class I SAM-dependent methyltransferase n=1 Tax=Candidatus Nitrososphaera sp. FF02 TaxID=3398226 RepID=UPI0039EC577C